MDEHIKKADALNERILRNLDRAEDEVDFIRMAMPQYDYAQVLRHAYIKLWDHVRVLREDLPIGKHTTAEVALSRQEMDRAKLEQHHEGAD